MYFLFCIIIFSPSVVLIPRFNFNNLSLEDEEDDKSQEGLNKASKGGLIYGDYLQVRARLCDTAVGRYQMVLLLQENGCLQSCLMVGYTVLSEKSKPQDEINPFKYFVVFCFGIMRTGLLCFALFLKRACLQFNFKYCLSCDCGWCW